MSTRLLSVAAPRAARPPGPTTRRLAHRVPTRRPPLWWAGAAWALALAVAGCGVPALAAAPQAGGASSRWPSVTVGSVGPRTARVVPVGSRGGAVLVPPAQRVGWWRGSARLEDPRGASLLVGHVSDASGRPGAFARLARVRPGARVVWRSGSQVGVFRVVRVRFVLRTRPLPADVWRWRGPRRLHLVSCARRVVGADGRFHYTHNVVVTAVRVRIGRR